MSDFESVHKHMANVLICVSFDLRLFSLSFSSHPHFATDDVVRIAQNATVYSAADNISTNVHTQSQTKLPECFIVFSVYSVYNSRVYLLLAPERLQFRYVIRITFGDNSKRWLTMNCVCACVCCCQIDSIG